MILTLASMAWAADVHRYAVVVGANDGGRSDEPLHYAERDASRVAWVLEELGGVRSEDIVDLRNADADRVLSALSHLAERVRRRGAEDEEDLLFFYYSGHGGEDGLRLSNSQLPFSTLTAALQAVDVDVRVLVVDACQSGELTRLKGATPAEPFVIRADDRLDTEGMAIITSSAVGEDAQESDRLKGGIFTHHFVAGLMGAADASGDQRITLTEAYQYGYSETVKSTSTARFVQRPSFGFTLSGRSDLVLTQVAEPHRTASVVLDGPGQWWLFSGEAETLLLEVDVETEAMLSVPPGSYLVRLREDGGVRETRATFSRRESHRMVASRMPTVSPGRTVRKGLEEERAAWAVTLGPGLLGPTAPGLPPSLAGHLGVLVDLEPITLQLRLTGAGFRDAAPGLVLTQALAGVEFAGIKKIDAGPVAFGLGVRLGGHGIAQWFDSSGDAPPRQALTGRVGPVLGLDVPVGRSVIALSGGPDVQLYRRFDATARTEALESNVLPVFSLEWVHYVR